MKICLVVFSILISSVGFAAISENSVLEILSLPNMNAKEILQTRGESSKILKKIAFADDQPMKVRWKSLITFVELNPKNSMDVLNQASENEEWFMRNAAMVASANYDSSVAVDMAKKLIKDKALVVRSAAVDALVKIEPNDIREIFWNEIKADYNFKNKQSLWVRDSMAQYLAERPLNYEKSKFEDLAHDPSEEIQQHSKSALLKIKNSVQNSLL